jgi:hypothetical protein
LGSDRIGFALHRSDEQASDLAGVARGTGRAERRAAYGGT